MKKRILLADDHKIIRDGLRALLENTDGIEVVGEAETGRQAVLLSKECQPGIIIMDISMADLNGMEATRMILAEFPKIKVIALSMHTDRRFVAGMFKAGVSGFLPKDCAFDELEKAIHAVSRGEVYLSSKITGTLMNDYINRIEQVEAISPELTGREREVLQLISEGNTTREIAEKLCVSIKTIESHRRQIMEKLDCRSIAELTKYALKEGLTSLDT